MPGFYSPKPAHSTGCKTKLWSVYMIQHSVRQKATGQSLPALLTSLLFSPLVSLIPAEQHITVPQERAETVFEIPSCAGLWMYGLLFWFSVCYLFTHCWRRIHVYCEPPCLMSSALSRNPNHSSSEWGGTWGGLADPSGGMCHPWPPPGHTTAFRWT